jgi:3-oxocholest-4-en-26-oyl-CoA dehydrogenase beta subunit
MEFNFSSEQEELRKLAHKAFSGRDVLVEAVRAGLMGATIPAEYGGSELGFIEVCAILEQLGRVARPQALDAALLGALAVTRFGKAEHQRRYLPTAATGDALLILAIDTRLAAQRDGHGYRLSGVLDAVPFADQAARVVVAADAGLFLLDPKTVARAPQTPTDESSVQQLVLDEARVDEGDLLVPRVDDALRWLNERQTVALCALELGVAQTQLQMTAEYVMRRQQFGKPIGLFQAVAQRAGDMWVDVESMRLMTWRAAWLLGQDRPAGREVEAAAFFAADAGQRVANASQHLHAGIGFDRGYPLYRYFLVAKQLELSLGGANRRLAELGSMIAEVP